MCENGQVIEKVRPGCKRHPKPAGRNRLVSVWNEDQRIQASLGWGLAAYRFDRYKKKEQEMPVLCLDEDIAETVENLYSSVSLVRDLVNKPTEDMGPADLADATVRAGEQFHAKTEIVEGDDLLSENYPAIHAVGRASDRAPRFIRLSWGERVEDPLWVMPLYQPYKKQIKSAIADLNNVGKSSYGGCITAALFLEHFVEPETPWVHIDTFAWNQANRPGRPAGEKPWA